MAAIEPSITVSRDGRVTVWHSEDGRTIVDFAGRREDVDDPVLKAILRVLKGPDDAGDDGSDREEDGAQESGETGMADTYPPTPMTVQEAVHAGIIVDGSWGYGDRCPNCDHHDVFAVGDDVARCVWCGYVLDPVDTPAPADGRDDR